MTTARVSRNDPCPCGSGKKFKKCCLSSSESTPSFSQSLTSAPAAMRAPSEILPHTAIHSSIAAKKWNEVVFDAPLKNGGRLHAVLLYSDDGLSAGMIRRGEILILDLSEFNFRGPSTVVAIHRTSISDAVEAQVIRIVQFRDDDDLGKALFGQWKPPQGFVERWASCRRTIIMRMDFPDGQWCDIQLVRTVKWTEQNGVRVGGTVFLDLTDVGVRGWANVLEILCCPVPEEFGAGEIVTGTFKHSHGLVGELVLESEPKPISVTPSHLFWSEDRQNWVQVSRLQLGEAVKTVNGSTRVVSFIMTDRVEPVYNIEVENDHCYRIGDSGVLVHNQSVSAYRLGGKTATNLTPRPGKDDAPDGGLSLTETPGKGWVFPGGKNLLSNLGFDTEDDPTIDDPKHFLVRPGSSLIAQGWTLQKWAAARPSIQNDDRCTWPPPTIILFDSAQ